MKRLVLAAPFLATMTCLAGEIETVDSSPVAEGGDYIRRITIDEHHWSYVHVFTNASAVQTFKSTVDWPMKVRYLVVGGGGRGGDGTTNKAGSGGGGGGGVAEKDNELLAAGASWSVRVGKGAAELSTQAESSSISNGVSEICTVPGGGSGAYGYYEASYTYFAPIAGAAGGGGGYGQKGGSPGAIGTFGSYVLGMTPPTSGYAGGSAKNFAGGGGGGAGAAGGAGTAPGQNTYAGGKGGEGLISDITGENFVYGSGGGGGSINGTSNKGPGGAGGTNAGSGAGRDVDTGETLAATAPVPNSGAGGGGGCGTTKYLTGTAGAAGIVVIRYDLDDYPCVGGDWIKVVPKSRGKTTYIHIFTNAQEVGTFFNRSGRDLKMRYLVVGGGGAGGRGSGNDPGGGGGGGGVAEADKVVLATGAGWTVRVGAGSTEELTQAGGSSISNGVDAICAVPGGGSGGRREDDDSYSPACEGAAGGGGATTSTAPGNSNPGAAGTFASYVLGMTPPTDGYSGGASFSFYGGGGGGAGAKGDSPRDRQPTNHGGDGGEGLTSDITGEAFVYGSGGGGGAVNGGSNYGPGGSGGTNAGNGGGVVGKSSTESGTPMPATEPVPNSGAGGGGGSANAGHKTPTMGADGIVVIRYDYRLVDPGAVLIVR